MPSSSSPPIISIIRIVISPTTTTITTFYSTPPSSTPLPSNHHHHLHHYHPTTTIIHTTTIQPPPPSTPLLSNHHQHLHHYHPTITISPLPSTTTRTLLGPFNHHRHHPLLTAIIHTTHNHHPHHPTQDPIESIDLLRCINVDFTPVCTNYSMQPDSFSVSSLPAIKGRAKLHDSSVFRWVGKNMSWCSVVRMVWRVCCEKEGV